MTMNHRFVLMTVNSVKCHLQDSSVGEIHHVWVRTPFESLEFVFRHNRTIYSYSLILIEVV